MNTFGTVTVLVHNNRVMKYNYKLISKILYKIETKIKEKLDYLLMSPEKSHDVQPTVIVFRPVCSQPKFPLSSRRDHF